MPRYAWIRVDLPRTSEHVDFRALDEYRFDDGRGFPGSYRCFVRELGWGRLFGLWLVYPPVRPGYADGWHGRSRNLRDRLRAMYREGEAAGYDWMIEPDGHWAMVDTLYPFAFSENGAYLLWDVAARDAAGEFPVYRSARMDSIELVGPSLDVAMRRLQADAIALGAEFVPVEVDFEPLPAVALDEGPDR
jgi:hypothetical protein